MTEVVKIGGAVIDSEQDLTGCLRSFVGLKGKKILVHGGGRAATRVLESLGIKPKVHQGRRITDSPTLGVVVMVYAGLVNKNIVAQLQSMGCKALGMSGADLNLIRSSQRPKADIDFGFVGDIDEVNGKALRLLLQLRMVPVVCPITHSGTGQLLNTNADTIASQLAQALAEDGPTSLRLCLEKQGVLEDADNEKTLIPRLNEDDYVELLAQKKIHNGMIPKLANAFAAKNAGVSQVRIGSFKDLAQSGTEIIL